MPQNESERRLEFVQAACWLLYGLGLGPATGAGTDCTIVRTFRYYPDSGIVKYKFGIMLGRSERVTP